MASMSASVPMIQPVAQPPRQLFPTCCRPAKLFKATAAARTGTALKPFRSHILNGRSWKDLVRQRVSRQADAGYPSTQLLLTIRRLIVAGHPSVAFSLTNSLLWEKVNVEGRSWAEERFGVQVPQWPGVEHVCRRKIPRKDSALQQ